MSARRFEPRPEVRTPQLGDWFEVIDSQQSVFAMLLLKFRDCDFGNGDRQTNRKTDSRPHHQDEQLFRFACNSTMTSGQMTSAASSLTLAGLLQQPKT